MNNKKMEKLFERGCKNAKLFKYLTQPIAEELTKGSEDTVSAEQTNVVGFVLAVGMAMGEEVSRKKCIATGLMVGSLGIGLVTIGFVRELRKRDKEIKDMNRQIKELAMEVDENTIQAINLKLLNEG